MSMFNIPINRLHFIVCIKRANRKNRHNLYDKNLLVSIRNLKNTVTYNRDNSLICTTNYPVKTSAKAGIQFRNTGFRVKPGMTNKVKELVIHYIRMFQFFLRSESPYCLQKPRLSRRTWGPPEP